MTDRQKQETITTLNTIAKRVETLKRVIDDLDLSGKEKIDSARFFLEECIDIVLSNQKKRGKEFLSNDEIDNLIDKIYKEEGIKKFKDIQMIKKFDDFNDVDKLAI